MEIKNGRTDQAAALRIQAEEKARAEKTRGIDTLSPDEARQLIHELRVHQIELEMQNEELRRAQVELDAARAKYFDLYNLAPVGYLTVSEKGLILEANLTVATLLDAARGALVKQPFSRFILNEDQDIYYFHRRRLFDTGEPQVCEMRMVKSDGEIFWVRLDATMAQDSNDWPVCRVVMSDTTKRKTAELNNEKLQIQLQQAKKMEAVGLLAGGIAHEFNNLLQAMSGHTEILLMDTAPNDFAYSSLKAIQKSINRAAGFVQQLLQYSSKADSEKRHIVLNKIVDRARRILERPISTMIQVQVTTMSKLWTINADPVQMEQMLLNLGSNAVDAMPDGGKLLFEMKNTTIDDDYANRRLGAQPGKFVLLSVSDTGQGMDKASMEKIFDPFFTTKEFGKGTGLGLASVYGIVKNHGGYITCYSEVGQGTTFKIYFPAIEEPEVAETENGEPQSTPRGTGTVLLVDDEAVIRGFAEQALIKFGYKVLTASTGEEALKLYSTISHEIDLVILYLGVPGMGGYKCLQELQQIDREVKVIIASGYSINGQVKQSMKAGAKGYVGKPYQLTDLLNTVRVVLDENG